MAITTYSELKTAVANWLHRSDLTEVIPDFISLAESRFNKTLKTLNQETTVTLSVTSELVSLPADFLEVRNLILLSSPNIQVKNISPAQASFYYDGVTTGRPRMYAILGDDIKLYPTPDGTYSLTLDYYAKIPALSTTNTTNWLLTNHPDIYLFGTLTEAIPYVIDDERLPIWQSKLQESMELLNRTDWNSRFNGSTMRIRTDSTI